MQFARWGRDLKPGERPPPGERYVLVLLDPERSGTVTYDDGGNATYHISKNPHFLALAIEEAEAVAAARDATLYIHVGDNA